MTTPAHPTFLRLGARAPTRHAGGADALGDDLDTRYLSVAGSA